jgi:hypothetical protein
MKTKPTKQRSCETGAKPLMSFNKVVADKLKTKRNLSASLSVISDYWTSRMGDGEVPNPTADKLKLDAEERFAELKQIQMVNLVMEITMIFIFVAIVAAVCL